jgi:DNA polymerase-1
MQTLLIVDGHAYAYRAFHAIRELHSPSQQPVNAIFGFIKMLGKLRAFLKPDAVVVVWDGGLSEERLRDLPGYKANRPPMPDSLGRQIDEIQQYLAAVGTASICQDGVEADDYIGSLAVHPDRREQRVVIASSDKDFMQLVTDHVGLVNPGDKIESIWGHERVMEKAGVAPGQIVDWLSLIGDSVDNIPGVPGVGTKTATSLLQKFKSLEGIYGGLADVSSERIRKSLADHKEAVFRNRTLIRLNTRLEVVANANLLPGAPKPEVLRELFTHWGFRSMLAELDSQRSVQAELI